MPRLRMKTARACTACCALIYAVLASACGHEEPQSLERDVDLFASTEHGEPVLGARLWASGRELGVTSDDGHLRTHLSGRAGDTLTLTWSCPPAYRSSGERRNLPLGELGATTGTATPPLALRVGCEPIERQAALVVRARGPDVAGLPIRVRDEPAGQTDTDGTAHLLVRTRPGSSIRVAIDTSQHPALRPSNPVQIFQVGDEDGVMLFAQDFERESMKPRSPKSIARPPAPDLPYRIR